MNFQAAINASIGLFQVVQMWWQEKSSSIVKSRGVFLASRIRILNAIGLLVLLNKEADRTLWHIHPSTLIW